MAQQRKKLNGWWKNLPFILLPTALFSSFAYLETSRLHLQYEKTDVIGYIQQLEKEIAVLSAQEQDITNIGDMEVQSSDHGLHPPDPKQVVKFGQLTIESAYAKVSAYQELSSETPLTTRSVLLKIDYEDGAPNNNVRGPFLGGVVYGQEEGD